MRLLLPLLLACGAGPSGSDSGGDSGAGAGVDTGAAADLDCADAPTVTWQGWADGFFQGYCRSCHSADTPDRRGAPDGVDFDTLAQVRDQAEAIRWSVLEAERMPVGGGVHDEDLVLLDAFLACGL